ncbi:hypothetical protein PISMIDRAFT_43715, partial [Pisolithus microcarpus 441]
MNDCGAFDFIDLASILWGCHLIPAFAKGRSHSDHTSLSPVTKDTDDWNYYYINRFADRDMLLRYHWGLGVGHMYSHVHSPAQCDLESECNLH